MSCRSVFFSFNLFSCDFCFVGFDYITGILLCLSYFLFSFRSGGIFRSLGKVWVQGQANGGRRGGNKQSHTSSTLLSLRYLPPPHPPPPSLFTPSVMARGGVVLSLFPNNHVLFVSLRCWQAGWCVTEHVSCLCGDICVTSNLRDKHTLSTKSSVAVVSLSPWVA